MPISRTLVLNCAGIGSRLGLGRTKVLMELNNKTLLARHLKNFHNVRDLRIVVGYQSADVIAATLAIRRDVTFVYNHDYFETGTGYSFWLGARFGTEEVMEWDGDLLIHPEDAKKCIQYEGIFAAFSKKRTEDGVFCSIDQNGNVIGFARGKGEYEWTGPCVMPLESVSNKEEYIYPMLEKILPVKGIYVRAMDIDTLNDYQRAEQLVKEWEKDND